MRLNWLHLYWFFQSCRYYGVWELWSQLCTYRDMQNIDETQETIIKLATDDWREVREMQKTCKMRETHEKKGRTRDNVEIDYTLFTIRLFSRTIKFYPISHEKIPLSCALLPLLPRDGSRCETREICLMKQNKQHQITRTHVSHLTCVFLISRIYHESFVAGLTQIVIRVSFLAFRYSHTLVNILTRTQRLLIQFWSSHSTGCTFIMKHVMQLK